MVDILLLVRSKAGERRQLILGATQIFFDTASTKDFASPSQRDAFYQRWFGHYVEADPSSFFLARDESGAVIGYLAGCLDSFSPKNCAIIDDIGFYTPAFCAALSAYPSHLHINVKPGHQGLGIGHDLMASFFERCRESGSPGIHVVTGSRSRAVRFYRACGFAPIPTPDADPDLALLVFALAPKARS